MTVALTPRVDQMNDDEYERHFLLSEARTDAHNLSDHALLREARLAGFREIRDRHELIEAVAKAWVGL